MPVVGVALAVVTAALAVADEVVPKGGKPFFGQILQETDAVVVILGEGGLRAFPRHGVARIRHGRTLPRRRSLRVEGSSASRATARSVIRRSNRKIELVSTKTVSAEDPFTRKALSEFFSMACDPPLELVSARGQKSDGAELRIRLESKVNVGKAVRFYGLEIGRQADCRLTFVMERVSESGAQLLLQGGPLSYSLMGGGRGVRTRAYRGAIGTLLTALKTSQETAAIFGIDGGKDANPAAETGKGAGP